MNANHRREPTEPTESAAAPADRRDTERKHLRRRLARLIADREAAKQTANRAIRGS